MGPHPLWLLEELCENMNLKPGMRVLDMGCGKGMGGVRVEAGTVVVQSNKWAVIGFALMLSGPAVLMLAKLSTEVFGDMPVVLANIVSWAAIAVPAIGAAICCVRLFKWKKTGKLGRGLAIATVIMCNPFFYLYYFVVCAIMSSTLAGLPWM